MIKSLWINFITHSQYSHLRWKPTFIKSNIVYARNNKTYLAPHWEFCWLFLVFQWTGYSHEKEKVYDNFVEHECSAPLLQTHINELYSRINDLEDSIRNHRDEIGSTPGMKVDRDLWSTIK